MKMKNNLVDYIYVIECSFGSWDTSYSSIGGIFYNVKEAKKTLKDINKIGKINAKKYSNMLHSDNHPFEDESKDFDNQSKEFKEWDELFSSLGTWFEFNQAKVIKYEVNKNLLK